MRLFVLVILLISSPALAARTLLLKHDTSGYTLPEHRYVSDCKVSDNGKVKITMRRGDDRTRTRNREISDERVYAIKGLIRAAALGRSVSRGTICDGGDHTLYGFTPRLRVMLNEDLDCRASRSNDSRAAQTLVRMAENICRWDRSEDL